ncbi:SDR family oxidoreductase [Mycobacteriaceae bacterium NPDC060252]
MKITVVGATGQIGSRVVSLLAADGHEVVAASLSSGANVLTGEGLVNALAGSNVVIDVVNSPSFEDGPVMDFFTASARNLVDAANQTGVGHYVALSIVGTDALPDSGYMRAKAEQENIIAESGLPYTIVRATQFQEFAEAITDTLVVGDEVRVPDARIQLIAVDDVSAQVAHAAEAEPRNGIINIGGPEKFSFAEMAQAVLDARGDDKPVVVDSAATYFGTPVDDFSLVTGDDGVLTQTRFADWMARR